MSQFPPKQKLKYTAIFEFAVTGMISVTLSAALLPSVFLARAAQKRIVYFLVPPDYHYLNPLLLTWYYPFLCGFLFSGILCLIFLTIRRLLPVHYRHIYPLRSRDAVAGGWLALAMNLINYILTVLLVGCFLLWSHRVSRPTPLWIPTNPPDEAHRVTHPDGYSIIIDPDWETDFKNDRSMGHHNSERIYRSSVAVYPIEYLGTATYFWPFFSVTRYSDRPHISNTMRPTEFQGRPAFEHFLPAARKPPLQCGYELIFQRDDSWFHIAWFKYVSEQDSKTLTTLPPMIRTYIETFRDTKK